MEWTDLIPGYSAYQLLTNPINGEDVEDYAGCAPTEEACESDPVIAAQDCARCVQRKLLAGLSEVLPLAGVGIVKGAGGIIIKELAKSLAKAAAAQSTKSLGAAFLGPIGVGIAALSAADALTAIYKALDMAKAAIDAEGRYCRCGDG
ncbi:hypothetical protein [Neolewinella litorea]|uniref:Uncharacterized protein n=1 Tax=Neolewinella litorea TaxID=2562452 RepID=A0A4S4N8Q6_9BACT|nr:hypothetical protein [Neolewinella litorea]THH35592.1 hypothetical protein E4021_16010 [Neolewinella litorea]